MKFIIFKVENGFLLNIHYSSKKTESYVYTPRERMTMFAKIDQLCGAEPPDSIGMEIKGNIKSKQDA